MTYIYASVSEETRIYTSYSIKFCCLRLSFTIVQINTVIDLSYDIYKYVTFVFILQGRMTNIRIKWSIIALSENPISGQQKCSYTILMKVFLTRTSYTKLAVEGSRSLSLKLLTIRGLLQRGGVDVIEKSVPKGTHHYPEVVPPSEKKEKLQKRCVVCHQNGIRRETIYQCNSCRSHPGLCPAPCHGK